ncbi:MAG: hypothetical protein PWR03_676 [Tenuifilum sp.]|jgi:uncharacterized membrane protein (DUF373 family)|uniref:phosphate-starvation-inducible PsiE family protein n=1 Tax=Tenuifilum sp. TaxID=2760880 RepID=UPI0024AAD037|nr:phosphate-starvation-inducible PsiE family protein [Tenuifilum sp.]MDI3526493.1 hypothetical protein [Tenuifilum sp.]
MEKIILYFEKAVVITLIVFMALVVALLTFEMAVVIITEILKNNQEVGIVIDTNEVIIIFNFFINVLIALELFETVKLYLKENVFHPEIILMISLIAILRKVIILDYSKTEPTMVIAIALLIGSITTGYYLLKKSYRKSKE